MANRTLEMTIDRVELKESGSQKGQHLVIVTLIWPRPLIFERVNTKTLSFVGNVADLEKSDWIERIVCKERIDGAFGVELAVTERMSDSEIAEFFKVLGSSLMKLAGNEVEDLMESSFAGGLIKAPFLSLSKHITNASNEGPKLIASGSVCLHAKDSWQDSDIMSFKVPLTAPENIYKDPKVRQHGETHPRGRAVLKAGADNGVIEFTGKVY
jgi:hypothetical protein